MSTGDDLLGPDEEEPSEADLEQPPAEREGEPGISGPEAPALTPPD